MKIFTIGFTKKSAEEFFSALMDANVRRVVDVRLNNTSQLSGFAKRGDLRWFLKKIGGIAYTHVPELAPTKEIMDEFKKNGGRWAVYEKNYTALISNRNVENLLSKKIMDGDCLLCSEEKPDKCHRRLAVEYLRRNWKDVEIVHI